MSANALWLIFAMLAQGALALALLWYLGFIRIPLVLGGKVRMKDIALSREPWPEREKQVSNAFDNQFQLPVLFYLGGAVAIWFGPTLFEVALAVLFVATRYAHAFVHVTSNHVVRRFQLYTAGLVLLCVFWADLLVRLILVATGTT